MIKMLQYKHPKIDYYIMTTRKAYKASVKNKLIFWYLYNRYNIDVATEWLYRKQRNQIHTYIKFFDDIEFPYGTNREACIYVNRDKKCLFCDISIADKPRQIYCSNKCSNSHKATKPEYIKKLSDAVKKSWENLSTDEREIRCNQISEGNKSFYSNLSEEEYSEFWKEWNKTYSENCYTKYGYYHYFAVPEHIEEAKKPRKETNILRYGGPSPLCSEKIKEKVRKTLRETNEASGHWIKEEDISDFARYSKIVRWLTEKQPIHLLENIEKRGKASIPGAYHLDHKMPLKYGFENGILPYVIADIRNLEMIPAIDNLKKGSKYD